MKNYLRIIICKSEVELVKQILQFNSNSDIDEIIVCEYEIQRLTRELHRNKNSEEEQRIFNEIEKYENIIKKRNN